MDPWDEKEDWFPDLSSGDDIFLKEVDKKLYWWNSKLKWEEVTKITLHEIACHQNNNFGELKKVISSQLMAEVTVKIAKILRDHGIDECRYNESLNCLQDAIESHYLDGWAGQPAATEYGAYDYWEAAHKRAGISRSCDTK